MTDISSNSLPDEVVRSALTNMAVRWLVLHTDIYPHIRVSGVVPLGMVCVPTEIRRDLYTLYLYGRLWVIQQCL